VAYESSGYEHRAVRARQLALLGCDLYKLKYNTHQRNSELDFWNRFYGKFRTCSLQPNDKPNVVLNYIEKCVQRLPAHPVFDRIRPTVESVFQQPIAIHSAINSGLRSGRRDPFSSHCIVWKQTWKDGGGRARQVGVGTCKG
jgi:hypothetical protein